MELYTRRSQQTHTEGFFVKKHTPVYCLRARLEMNAEEKKAFYDARIHARAAVVYYDFDTWEETDVLTMELVDAPFIDFRVKTVKRIEDIEHQLKLTILFFKQEIERVLRHDIDIEVVEEV